MNKRGSLYPACLAMFLLGSLLNVRVWAGDSESEAAFPKGWPKQLDKRDLYPSKCGFVYAGSKSAAAQVNKLIETAVKELRASGATTPKDGLVLVVDLKEEPPFNVEEFLTRLAMKQDQQRKDQQSQDALKSLKDGKKQLEELGLDLSLLLSMAPMPIEPNMLPDLIAGFPRDADLRIGWCATVPTESNIRYGMKKMLDAAMKKEKIGAAKRLAMLPVLAYAESKAIRDLKKGRQDALNQLVAGKYKKHRPVMGEQNPDEAQEPKP